MKEVQDFRHIKSFLKSKGAPGAEVSLQEVSFGILEFRVLFHRFVSEGFLGQGRILCRSVKILFISLDF